MKASILGVYLPSHLDMDEGENVIDIVDPGDYSKSLLLFFENGKCARLGLSAYATKTNRRKLTGAYSDKSPLRSIIVFSEELEIAAVSTEGRAVVFTTALLQPKTSRSTQGVGVMTLKTKYKLDYAQPLEKTFIKNQSRYRVKSLPAAGALLRDEDRGEEQMTLI
jgi:DNA gyrase subunit A